MSVIAPAAPSAPPATRTVRPKWVVAIAVVVGLAAGVAIGFVVASSRSKLSEERTQRASVQSEVDSLSKNASNVPVSIFTLEEGECFTTPTDSLKQSSGDPGSFRGDAVVAAVACTESHLEEVYAVVPFPDATDTFPGQDAVFTFGQTECLDRYEAYVGVPLAQSELTMYQVFPTEESWTAGDHDVVCIVVAQNNVTTSAKDSRK